MHAGRWSGLLLCGRERQRHAACWTNAGAHIFVPLKDCKIAARKGKTVLCFGDRKKFSLNLLSFCLRGIVNKSKNTATIIYNILVYTQLLLTIYDI